MTPYKRALWLSAALALGALAACESSPGSAATGPKQAPDFNLPTLTGSRLCLGSARGPGGLPAFWATWCEPCKDSIPVFERLNTKYKDKGLVVLGVNVDGSSDDVPAFVKQLK